MCKPGNQTIYAICRNKALQSLRRTYATNADMRQVIYANGNDGCLMSKAEKEARLAQQRERVLVS